MLKRESPISRKESGVFFFRKQNNLDLALIVRNLDEIATIAKYARQISRHYHDWEVFLFNQDLSPLGRICHRKKWPEQSIGCSVRGCGRSPHLRAHAEFEHNEKTFLTPPIEVIWTFFETSQLRARQEELGVVESGRYEVLEHVKMECIICAKPFMFTGGEHKWCQKRGLTQPKRCPDCIEQEQMEGLRNW